MYKPDFLIIPGKVAFDADLPYSACVLYGIIYWLSKLAKGECTASNESLAEHMRENTHADTIRKHLQLLEDKGYIKREYMEKEKMNRTRIIPMVRFMVDETTQGVGETIGEGRRNDPKRVGETSTQISNIDKEKDKEQYSVLPMKGNTPLSRLKGFYTLLFRHKYNLEPKVYLNGKDGGVLKSLLKDLSEVQVAALIITHFHWHGPSGRDENEHAKLHAATFPISWMSPNVNRYTVWLTDQEKVKWDDPKDVFNFVDEYLKEKMSTQSPVF